MQKITLFLITILIGYSNVYAKEAQTETKLASREIHTQSNVVLPKGSVRVGLFSPLTIGVGKGFEVGTWILGDVFGLLNLQTSYNFLNKPLFSLSASVNNAYFLKDRRFFIEPGLESTFFISRSFHEHVSLFSGYPIAFVVSNSGLVNKIGGERSIRLSTTSEYRIFKNNKYSRSWLGTVNLDAQFRGTAIHPLLAVSHMWAWKKFHLQAGLGFKPQDFRSDQSLKGFSPIIDLFWVF